MEEIRSVLERLGHETDPALSDPATDAGMLSLLQFQLLAQLAPDRTQIRPGPGRLELADHPGFGQLLTNRALLELFLSSGDCASCSVLSPDAPADRWAAAVLLLLRLIEIDSACTDDPFRRRLAVGCALGFSSPVHLLDSNEALREGRGVPVEPVARYLNFVDWHREGRLFGSFDQLMPWQLRFVFRSMCSDQELDWAQSACADLRRARELQPDGSAVELPGDMVKFTSERNGHDVNDAVGFYGHGGHISLQEYAECGGVCGAISFFATGAAQAFGLPAFPVGQPGHCALLVHKRPGLWYLANDISGWASSKHLHGGGVAGQSCGVWNVPLMEQAQAEFAQYSLSERIRTAAGLGPSDRRGELLAEATAACPFNLRAWEERVEHVRASCCDCEPWVGRALEAMRASWFGKEGLVISKGRPVRCSDVGFEYACENLVDCSDSVWHTTAGAGWVEIDLGQDCAVSGLTIDWESGPARQYRVLAAAGGRMVELGWPVELSRGAPVEVSESEEMAGAITDGEGYGAGDTIWYAERETAWLQIELPEPCRVTAVHIQWWGLAVASTIAVSSSVDGGSWTVQRTQADASSVPRFRDGEINGWHGGIPGWPEPTRFVRIELADGHPDGWNHGKLFGIRNVRVMGRRPGEHGAPTLTPVRTAAEGSHNGRSSRVAGWAAPTRVVRLELETAGGGERFGIRRIDVHGGPVARPTAAVEVLRAEVAFRLNRETVRERHFGGRAEALQTGLCSDCSSGKGRPLILAVEYLHGLLDAPGSTAPTGLTDGERRSWLSTGLCASVGAKLLVLADSSARGDRFCPERNMCYNDGFGGWAEYRVCLEPGRYCLFTHHTSADPRPLQLRLDGVLCGEVASEWTSGSNWGPDTMAWFRQPLTLTVSGAASERLLRLQTEGCWPHISAILFSPVVGQQEPPPPVPLPPVLQLPAPSIASATCSEEEELQAAIRESLKPLQTWEPELNELREMGFADADRNRALLDAHNGNVGAVLDALL